ncbi:porin [Oxalobacter aliiformigenes]|uniref:porin n=1 Tax=Oxalobacter aliiformigenes TaxID=2946593 RepID=UPI002FCDC200
MGENTDKDSRDETGTRLKLADADNDGYAISLNYSNGPLYAVANWNRLADSKDSSVWNLGAFYKFGPAKVSLGYEKTHDKGYKLGSAKALKESTQDNWILGLQYAIGAGRINASFSYMDIDHARDWDGTKDIKKYSLGYEYDLSKRTTLYAMISHSDFEDTELSHSVSGFYRKNKESDTIATNDHITGIQFGMTHRF